MSSKEIADLLDVRHDNVKVTIERLVNRGVIDLPAMQEHQTETSHGRKHNLNVYLLEKRDSYVVVAQLSPEFTARVVDRWQELVPARTGQPTSLAVDQPTPNGGWLI
jgi:phage regulator Rha-like protein